MTVSFEIRWGGSGRRKEIRNAKERFRAQIAENTSTMEFQVEAGEFKFASGPASTTKNVYSLIGRERNGVLFQTPSGCGPSRVDRACPPPATPAGIMKAC